MSPGIWQILIVVLIVLILFGGRGKIAAIMGDAAKGIKAFKKGLNDEEGTDGSQNAAGPSAKGNPKDS